MKKVVKDGAGKSHTIKIDDDLQWLAPYITYAKKFGIPVWRIAEIKGYSVPPDKIERQHAAISRKDGSSKFKITLLKERQVWVNKKGRFKVESYVKCDEGHFFEFTLDTLAHELSHIVHWDHNADRFILEKKLTLAFAKLSKRRGYKGYDKPADKD